jgi:aldehyde dehydrogenase (NAD+)
LSAGNFIGGDWVAPEDGGMLEASILTAPWALVAFGGPRDMTGRSQPPGKRSVVEPDAGTRTRGAAAALRRHL